MVAEEQNYLFGPVQSRRLGRSLGVDIVPFKTCTLDCIYCQLGRTTNKTIQRKDYVPVEPVLAELKSKLAEGVAVDFITLGGSGEPTLNSRLGELIKAIKRITSIPVAILTNGTLLYQADVREDCAKADLVLPSLDAGDEKTFQKINRPHKDISNERLIDGLCKFRTEFTGQIWLEVFLVESINTQPEQIEKIKAAVRRISPDKVQLNTAVRPTAQAGVGKVELQKLQAIATQFGENCEVIADFSLQPVGDHIQTKGESVAAPEIKDSNRGFPGARAKMATLLSMLKRRPCSLNDVCMGLDMHRNEALKYIGHLKQQGVIDSEDRDGIIFFKTK